MPRTECFDQNLEQYEGWFDENRIVYQTEVEAVRHMLPKSGTGFEVGIGSGRFAIPLGIQAGVEPSEKMRRLAVQRGLKVYEGVGETLPFDDETYDFALMVTTICFLDDVERSFLEVRRVIRPGGSFVVGFVDRDSPLGKVYERHKHENAFYRDATFYSAKEVISHLERAGYAHIEAIQTVFGKLSGIDLIQDFKEGHGQGGFVVLRALKPARVLQKH